MGASPLACSPIRDFEFVPGKRRNAVGGDQSGDRSIDGLEARRGAARRSGRDRATKARDPRGRAADRRPSTVVSPPSTGLNKLYRAGSGARESTPPPRISYDLPFLFHSLSIRLPGNGGRGWRVPGLVRPAGSAGLVGLFLFPRAEPAASGSAAEISRCVPSPARYASAGFPLARGRRVNFRSGTPLENQRAESCNRTT